MTAVSRTLREWAGIDWNGSRLEVVERRPAQNYLEELNCHSVLTASSRKLFERLCSTGHLEGVDAQTLFNEIVENFAKSSQPKVATQKSTNAPNGAGCMIILLGVPLALLCASLLLLWQLV